MYMKHIYILLVIAFFLPHCATQQEVPEIMHPVSKMFPGDYQKVWRAAMLALEDYPIEEENNEKGYLKTEPIDVETVWKFPFARNQDLKAAKYTLHVWLRKGYLKDQPTVKVQIVKKIMVQKGFMDEPERVPSNGLEEQGLLYRIMREINIEQALANYYKKSSL